MIINGYPNQRKNDMKFQFKVMNYQEVDFRAYSRSYSLFRTPKFRLNLPFKARYFSVMKENKRMNFRRYGLWLLHDGII